MDPCEDKSGCLDAYAHAFLDGSASPLAPDFSQATRFSTASFAQFRNNVGKLARRLLLKCATVILVLSMVITYPACGGGFLGLEDYQRDLLFGLGSLGVSLLSPAGTVGPVGPAGEPGPVGEANPGTPGLACWDLNGNGQGDPEEDVNSDEVFDALDCQGADGQDAADGQDGTDGQNGADGQDGTAGATGAAGASGGSGAMGPAGPTLFDTYIDDFFTVDGGSYGTLNLDPDNAGLPVIKVREPALGLNCHTDGEISVLGYRVAVSTRYTAGNPITMTLYFWRQGPVPENCFLLRLDAFTASHGTGISQYGGPRFVRPYIPGLTEEELQAGTLLVVDLPLNVPAEDGLGFPSTVQPQDLLAFELNTVEGYQDGGCYTLIGVDFFESEAGAPVAIKNAAVFDAEEAIDCEFECFLDEDCNDGTFCNGAERCIGGFCVPADAPANCDDEDICTADSCDPELDECVHSDLPNCCDNGGVCNDNNECTEDQCIENLCEFIPIDTDVDGTPDCNETCPDDPNKTEPGVCDCGVPDTDSDGDGTADCNDMCPDDPNKIDAGQCGCDNEDTDTDEDGTADCIDDCPDDPDKIDPGLCGCGESDDLDSDGDGIPDCVDDCPISEGPLCPEGCTLTCDLCDDNGCTPSAECSTCLIDFFPDCNHQAENLIPNLPDANGCTPADQFTDCINACACANEGDEGPFQSCVTGDCTSLIVSLDICCNNGCVNSCTGGLNTLDFLDECCDVDADCNDGDSGTIDSCGADGLCDHVPDSAS